MTADSAVATIMIIDDEPDNLNVLGEMLRSEGWHVRAFPDGEMAIAAACDEAPDLVLLDIRMPGLDGYEVCTRFRADEKLRLIPIVFLSAFAEAADKVRAFAVGGVDYVTKPFAALEVLARTRTHLRLRQYQLHLEELVRQRVKELAEAHRRLRIWDDAKTQWLNTLSHEMRTPLQGVFGVAELLFADVPKTPETVDLLDAYTHSRSRITKLIDDAITLANIDVGAEGFATTPVQLSHILEDALSKTAETASGTAVCASLGALGTATVSVQPGLLCRAFTDLLFTAICCVRANDPVTLTATLTGEQVHVVIGTAGEALPAAALDTFFAVGGQRALLKSGGDYGLGPALASRIIQLFSGRITVRNGAEQGILIETWLPTGSNPVSTEGNTP